MQELSTAEIERYSRQLIIQGWSSKLQCDLKALSVAVPYRLPQAALYLAAAGVGSLCLYGNPKDSGFPNFLEHIKSLAPTVNLIAEPDPENFALDFTIKLENSMEAADRASGSTYNSYFVAACFAAMLVVKTVRDRQ